MNESFIYVDPRYLPKEELNKFLKLTLAEELIDYNCTSDEVHELESITSAYHNYIDVFKYVDVVMKKLKSSSLSVFKALDCWRWTIIDYFNNGYKLAV